MLARTTYTRSEDSTSLCVAAVGGKVNGGNGVSLATAMPADDSCEDAVHGRAEQEVRVSYLIVFNGPGIGGMLRHGVNIASGHLFGRGFPVGTLVANIVGSLLMGLLVGVFALKGHGDHHLRLFLATGVLGGFTTFSTFSLDAVTLYRRGEFAAAAAYAVGSITVSVGAFFLGLYLVRRLV